MCVTVCVRMEVHEDKQVDCLISESDSGSCDFFFPHQFHCLFFYVIF